MQTIEPEYLYKSETPILNRNSGIKYIERKKRKIIKKI